MDSLNLIPLYKASVRQYVRVMVIVTVAIVAVSLIMPQTFTSECTIMPPEDKSSGGGLASLLQSAPVNIGLGSSPATKTSNVFKDILVSRTLYEGVIDTLDLMENDLFEGLEKHELVELLAESVTVTSKKTGMLIIEANAQTGWFPFDDTPGLAATTAADIANACRMVLDRMNRVKSVSRARQTRAYIERVLADTRKEIDTIQQRMLEFQTENKVIALDEQMAALVDNAVMIGTELAKAELELTLIKQDYNASSPQVEMYEKKVSSLQEQYDRVQTGGLVTTDGFSIPFDKVPELTRQYTNLVRDQKIKEQINAFLETQRMQELIQEAKGRTDCCSS